MSISSTPKPSLRPFFSSSKSLLDSSNPYLEIDKVRNSTGYRVSFGRYLVKGSQKLAKLQSQLNGEQVSV